MQLASYILSLCLHAALLLTILFWPASRQPLLDMKSVQISLVDGAPGGNRLPSPVLGPQGAPGEKMAPAEPAPQKPEVSRPPEAAAPVVAPREEPKKVEPKPKPPEPKPKPKPKPREPEPDAKAISPKKQPDKKREPPKEEKKTEPRKPEPKTPDPAKAEPQKGPVKNAPKGDPVKDALAKARAASSRDASGTSRGTAVDRALAEARRKAGGHGGGGGGEGEGPGGGGLHDVFLGQVMMAVRPNWMYASASRANLVCVVHVRLDSNGKLLDSKLIRSSGNSQYDASAVNAVIRTGSANQFPPPPGPEYMEFDLGFNLSEMRGR